MLLRILVKSLWIFSIISFVVSSSWLWFEIDFEPIIAFIGSLIGLASLYVTEKTANRFETDDVHSDRRRGYINIFTPNRVLYAKMMFSYKVAQLSIIGLIVTIVFSSISMIITGREWLSGRDILIIIVTTSSLLFIYFLVIFVALIMLSFRSVKKKIAEQKTKYRRSRMFKNANRDKFGLSHDIHNGICKDCGCSSDFIKNFHPRCRHRSDKHISNSG